VSKLLDAKLVTVFVIKIYKNFTCLGLKIMEEILRGEDIVKFVKTQRLAWLGLVERIYEERMSRKGLHWKMEEIKRRGKPRKRWLQDLKEDLRVMQVGRWWKKVQSKEEWRRIVREAKAHPGL
jgi:hypothetical protein